jgi:hypothetical protein
MAAFSARSLTEAAGAETETDGTEKPEGKKRIGSVGRKCVGASPGMIQGGEARVEQADRRCRSALRLIVRGPDNRHLRCRSEERSFDRQPRHRFSNVCFRNVALAGMGAGAQASGFSPEPIRSRFAASRTQAEHERAAKKFCAIIRAAQSAFAANLPVIRPNLRFSGDAYAGFQGRFTRRRYRHASTITRFRICSLR